jgi:hypothetical protein
MLVRPDFQVKNSKITCHRKKARGRRPFFHRLELLKTEIDFPPVVFCLPPGVDQFKAQHIEDI